MNIKLQEKSILSLWCLLYLVYFTLRAIYVPVIHDEAATFYFYLQKGEFLPFLSHVDANNHFLNTLLSWLSYKAFGFSSLALRLPNLLFIPVYFYYVYRLSGFCTNKKIKWLFIITLLCTHTILDFMGLCRGYGISFALLPGILFLTVRYFKLPNIKGLIKAGLLFLLALSANLNLIFSGCILTTLLILHFIVSSVKPTFYAFSLTLLFLWVAPLLFFTKYLLFLDEYKQLYHGAHIGFVDGTVRSAIATITGTSGDYVFATAIFTFVLSAFLLINFIFKNKGTINIIFSKQLLPWILIGGNIFIIIFLAKVKGTNYPEDRTTIHLSMYFIIATLFSIDYFISWKPIQKTTSILLTACFLYFPFYFINRLNTQASSPVWDMEDIPHRYYKHLSVEISTNIKEPYTIGGYGMEQFMWAIQNYSSENKLPILQYNTFPDTCFDYQLCDTAAFPGWHNYYTSVLKDDLSNVQLLKRKTFLNFKTDSAIINTPKQTSEVYINLFDAKIETLKNNTIYLKFNSYIKFDAVPFLGAINCAFRNDKDEAIREESFPINWHYNTFNGEVEIDNGVLISQIPKEAKRMIIYLWNYEETNVNIASNKITFYSVEPEPVRSIPKTNLAAL